VSDLGTPHRFESFHVLGWPEFLLSKIEKPDSFWKSIHQGAPEFVYIFAEIAKTPPKIKI